MTGDFATDGNLLKYKVITRNPQRCFNFAHDEDEKL
jgi:hypothetical protein